MKTTLFTLALLTAAFTVQAQDGPETLVDLQHMRFSGFGGPSIHGTSINGTQSVLVGGYGGMMLNQTLLIGGGGWGLVNNVDAPDAIQTPGQPKQYIRLGYGGFYMEYVHNPLSLFHLTASTLIGAGGVLYSHDMKTADEDNGNPFFVVEPSLNAEINMTDFLRTNVGVSYRWVNGLDMAHLSNKDLSQVSVNVNFKFGWFGKGSYYKSDNDEEYEN